MKTRTRTLAKAMIGAVAAVGLTLGGTVAANAQTLEPQVVTAPAQVVEAAPANATPSSRTGFYHVYAYVSGISQLECSMALWGRLAKEKRTYSSARIDQNCFFNGNFWSGRIYLVSNYKQPTA